MNDNERRNGWGGRIRTCACRYQKPVPYRLATPQQFIKDHGKMSRSFIKRKMVPQRGFEPRA